MTTRISTMRPRIGITIGDAAGIGPEITLKAVSDMNLRSELRCVLIGDLRELSRVAKAIGVEVPLVPFGNESSESIEVIDLANLPATFVVGQDAATTGKASAENLVAAVNEWRSGNIDAICTAPISKKAIALGGFDFPGHTEFLASLTHTKDFRMSFFAGQLRVVLLSTHLSLRKAIERVSKESLVDLIRFCEREVTKLLGRKITIAVAGLNPHASEGGLFGDDESREIKPAIEQCVAAGIDVSGPYSPDTIFLRGYRGDFDVVVALYHDQATIAVKSLSFGKGVNVTLGLPVIRTSVDHGTAYDIAGKGIADASSMVAAIETAGDLVRRSQREGDI